MPERRESTSTDPNLLMHRIPDQREDAQAEHRHGEGGSSTGGRSGRLLSQRVQGQLGWGVPLLEPESLLELLCLSVLLHLPQLICSIES